MRDLTRIPSAVRLEMAPKVMVKKDIPKLDGCSGVAVVLDRALS